MWHRFLGGYETTPETGQVSYRFHTPHQKQTGFIPGFIPRRGSLVSYPVSYLVSYLSRNKGVEAHGEPRRQERYLPNSCPEKPACGFIPVSYRFHTRFHTRAVQTKLLPRFGSYAGRRFHIPVSYLGLAACGFIPRSHTGFIPPVSYPGFIPVSYRFHTGFRPYRKNGRFHTP